ncbi:MAG: DUF3343 domain-containing protein [Clostridia bacterium]|nr:DUF3343 domain-containing protein [Clostridia bacterium]
MEYVIVAVRSRSTLVGLSDYLTKMGVRNQIVNTPKEAGVGCGLSIKISPNLLLAVKRAVSIKKISVAGYFLVKTVGGKSLVKAI